MPAASNRAGTASPVRVLDVELGEAQLPSPIADELDGVRSSRHPGVVDIEREDQRPLAGRPQVYVEPLFQTLRRVLVPLDEVPPAIDLDARTVVAHDARDHCRHRPGPPQAFQRE